MSFEDQVRERAYHIWLSGGMADGMAHEHWAMAEQAVKADAPVVILTKDAKTSAPKAKAASKTAKPAAKASPKKADRGEMRAAP